MEKQHLARLIGDFRPSVMRTARFALAHRTGNIAVGRRFRFAGPGDIVLDRRDAPLRFGVTYCGFMDGRERSLIRNTGTLRLRGGVTVANGNRWDILTGATLDIGDGTYFGPNGVVVAGTTLTIGAGCAIGWSVQFLDDDFHDFGYAGEARPRSLPISLGDRVWIGSHAKIFKGVRIADGCVVAANATVTRSVDEPGCLIAGSPATIVRRDVHWT
jgi:acetyltransferase-like isoleucine patch superfamily enzyme